MNTHIINVIIKREYLNRVKKKSFLIITFLGPLLFAALCILPSIIMLSTKEEAKVIAVVDDSGIVLPYLQDSETVTYKDCTGTEIETIKADLGAYGADALLTISPLDSVAKSVKAEAFSKKPLGMDMTENIDSKINDAIEAYRIDSYEIDNLDEIMSEVHSNTRMKTYTLGDDGKETITESGVYMLVSMILGMIIYMFIALFGGQVMSSVIEEKKSRVVEVLVSSVKSTELMFGKIIGVALVALTQFLLWIVLTFAILGVATTAFGGKIQEMVGSSDPSAMVENMNPGINMAGMDMNAVVAESVEENGLGAIMTTVQNLPVAQILIAFVLFFLFGYLLYASLFAAIGSAVENEADTQQLQIPLTIPLMLGFFIALYAFKAPDSNLVFWSSMFPFTSPIVMLARIPFGVPVWQLALSIVLLVATFVGCAIVSAKIYKVGILMYGKKSTFKDLWKWLKMN
ncbi:MAG: ABC transporter permease [Bacteroidales bacterium]|nr:ABC transporter permease [Bacteroidales bacterium]